MDFKVIYKDTFLDDLKHIVQSIATENPAAAQKLGEAILDLCESLSFLPERHPRIHQRPEVRRFVARRHFKVFYRIRTASQTVEVLRCWDGRRGTEPGLDVR